METTERWQNYDSCSDLNSPCSGQKFCIALFYRPPSSDVQIFSHLFSFLESLSPSQFSTFLLLGDFNINFLKPHHPLFHKLSDILYSFALEQLVPSYTHVSPNGSTSLIDLALLSTPTLLRSCSVIPPLANSDHFGLLLDIKWKTNTKQARSEKRKIWRYAHADFQRACRLIDSTDWESILCHDVDQSILQWNNCFLNIMEQCIPKAILGRRRNLPWLTKNISSAIRKRNYLFKRARSSGRRDHVEKYKRMRNRVTTMLRNGKKLFFQNLNPHNNRQFWKAMKYLRKQTSPSLISPITMLCPVWTRRKQTCSMTTSQSASTDHNLLYKPQTVSIILLLMTAPMRFCAQSQK